MTKRRSLWRAWTSTRNWNLEAYGETENEALSVLAEMWQHWKAKTGAQITVDEIIGDTNTMRIKAGKAYFDFEEYKAKNDEKCERCYGKDPEYVHPDDGDPYSDIYEVCPDCNRLWNEGGPQPQ